MMKSLSSVGVGLSVVFGCLLLALVAELYYLIWWKRMRITGRNIEEEEDYHNPARQILYIFCWKTKKQGGSFRSTATTANNNSNNYHLESGFQLHTNMDLFLRPFDESCVEAGLMMPPRFLFTIKEETKEDLESEDGCCSKGGSKRLSDFLKIAETPFVTPLSSPPFFTPPLTPSSPSSGSGYNPLYESSSDVEFSRMRFSPPSKFKFLRDAEEKLQRNAAANNTSNSNFQKSEEEEEEEEEKDGSFVTIIVANNKDVRQAACFSSSSSSSSQVLPLTNGS